MSTIKIVLNGREVECRRGQTILDVAKAQGVRIPTLCYHPQVSRTGACRICLVRVNQTMFKTACTEPVADGMKIVTADPEITAMRRGILEFLLAEGDHNCLYCEANGGCELQTLCHEHGLDTPPPAGLPARCGAAPQRAGPRRVLQRGVAAGGEPLRALRPLRQGVW